MTQAVGVLTAAVVTLSGFAANTISAQADVFGQIGAVGEFGGTGTAQLHWPVDLAVDPEEGNSVFVVDSPEGTSPGFGPANVRVQKFESTLGAPVASATIPVPEEPVEGLTQFVTNIAVDPSLHRLYVLKRTRTPLEANDKTLATEIDVYSTIQTAGKTLPLDGVFYEFPTSLFTEPEPAGALPDPHGLAVEPGGTHALLVLGTDEEGYTVVQRIQATGPSFETGEWKAGEEFNDTGEGVVPHGKTASGIAVGSQGAIYLSGHGITAGGGGVLPGVVKLSTTSPNSLADPAISVVHKLESGEAPPLTGGSRWANTDSIINVGEQLAVSPDGTVVYGSAVSKPEEEEEEEPGSYEVRGMSTATGAQQIVYGGGTSACHIESERYAIAAGSGGVVYVLDEGLQAQSEEPEEPTPYGFHLLEFGPGGSGCPAPTTDLAINGKPEENGSTVSVQKGAKVEFEATDSELQGAEPTELTWEFSGPESSTEKITAGCPGSESCRMTSHRFLKPGSYTVTLNMAVTKSGFGPPPSVMRKIEVTAPSPTASFEASTLDPKPGETVTFNGSNSFDPTGGSCSQASGCASTNTLKSYTWNFGDGSSVTTEEPEVSHAFAYSGASPLPVTVELTVTDEEEVQSAPSAQALTIQGTPTQEPAKELAKESAQEPLKEPLKEVLIVKPKIPTNAQKLAAALKKCKKIKAKKRRASCEKQARRKYAPKPKKRHRHRKK